MDNLSKLIMEECQKRCVSKVALGKMLGITRHAIYKRLEGKTKWKVLELRELCRVWALPIDYFDNAK